MSRFAAFALCVPLVLAAANAASFADELLYAYEGSVLIHDASTGWLVFDECESNCFESVEDGAFTLRWTGPGSNETPNYHLWLADDPSGLPPPPFWVEWRFLSGTHRTGTHCCCDGRFRVGYLGFDETINLFGDAATSFSGDDVITGLELSTFYTYRLETPDGSGYCVAVDGHVFTCDVENNPIVGRFLQTGGNGGCSQFPAVNKWDFIRYGRIEEGETIVSSDPPGGVLDANAYPSLDRFTVTFDQPNYVYIDDITVGTQALRHEGAEGNAETAAAPPLVIATRRLDNGPPETVQIVLDRPLDVGVTTRFTFATGGTPNTVEYTLLFPTGACCDRLSGACTDGLTLDECSGGQQTWNEATACAQAACEPVTGACCNGDPFAPCTEGLTQAQCQCPGCQWTKGGACASVDCPRSVIPAVSWWGLTVLTLLLLIVAKLRFHVSPPRTA